MVAVAVLTLLGMGGDMVTIIIKGQGAIISSPKAAAILVAGMKYANDKWNAEGRPWSGRDA